MWLNIGLSWKITKIRGTPVLVSPKTRIELVETGVESYDKDEDIRHSGCWGERDKLDDVTFILETH